ncbi:MAG: hypothetical protein KGJ62_15020 [Armatimonadetes bacterium]|nr:hypothetical protein [Armatimonadota bacterium]MDE2207700.1 hypothetical protein [Armatimonadota bacterium]
MSPRSEWLGRWQPYILSESRDRYCDREMGEELGWLVSPFLRGFCYGYFATRETAWLQRLVDWSHAWMRRGVKEADGFIGWPKPAGASTSFVPDFTTDNMLGEAMALRPAVLMARHIATNKRLSALFGASARTWLELSEATFRKWSDRGCWRSVQSGGGVWAVPEFGIEAAGGQFTNGYGARFTTGFTLPANKQNAIAMWLLAMYDATHKPIYRQRAEAWFKTMRLRMKPANGGRTLVWNYWDPAGPWDAPRSGKPGMWVGVHPNGGYYDIDVRAIVCAYQHGIVFTREDINKLIATNRDFMWNQKVQGALFQRIDGGPADPRWKSSPGVLWTGLLPYDATLRKVFEANFEPASWGGLALTPWYLAEVAEASKSLR